MCWTDVLDDESIARVILARMPGAMHVWTKRVAVWRL
jgi:hypothetical protein